MKEAQRGINCDWQGGIKKKKKGTWKSKKKRVVITVSKKHGSIINDKKEQANVSTVGHRNKRNLRKKDTVGV